MTIVINSAVASVCLLASSLACANCSPAFTEQFTSTQQVVDSLRPDKPGQARVSASDGSEYTAGEASWMRGQLHSASQACAQGDESSAASLLRGVTRLLSSHHRAQ
jgi:hypothetical protein